MKKYHSKKHESNLIRIVLMILAVMIIAGNPGLSQETENRGIRMFENKNYYGAERYFREALEKNETEGQALYYLGRIAFEKEEMEEAAVLFEKAIETDPSNAEYFAWQGITNIQLLSRVDFMKQGTYASKALKSLEKAVVLDPTQIDARIWLAGYYANAPSFAGGSHEKAKEQFEKIFAIDPDNKVALLNQGIILTQFQEYEEAMVSFERILELQPDFYPACFRIGKLSKESGMYYQQGELSLIKFIDHATGESEDSKDDAWWLLGEIYLQQNKINEARQAFENAISLDPENVEYQKSLKNIL